MVRRRHVNKVRPEVDPGNWKELHYTGDANDSASMNIWLHKQMMAKLAANGGKLPPDVKY